MFINWIWLQYFSFYHFSDALGVVVEVIIVSEQITLGTPSVIDALRNAQKVCIVTKGGTVLN